MIRGLCQDVGATSFAAATSSVGGVEACARWRHGHGLKGGTRATDNCEPTNAMRTQSWECSGAAYAMSDLDGQSVVHVDEDVCREAHARVP